MLPAIKHSFTAAVAALAIAATPAAPAYAWGDREQGILTGVAATLLVGAIVRDARKPAQRATPVYVAPQTTYQPVYRAPVVSSSNSVYSTPAAQAFNSYTDAERRTIQRQLAIKGYYQIAVDGVFGPATYAAISAYARATGGTAQIASLAGSYQLYDDLIV